jgi:hypothetical protein
MKQPLKGEHGIRIDGKPATDAEYKRIVNRPALVARKETATKPPYSAVRGFQLLK